MWEIRAPGSRLCRDLKEDTSHEGAASTGEGFATEWFVLYLTLWGLPMAWLSAHCLPGAHTAQLPEQRAGQTDKGWPAPRLTSQPCSSTSHCPGAACRPR